MSNVSFPPPPPPGFHPPMPPPPGAPGADRRMAADAKFGPGAGDAFKQAFDVLHPGPGQDPRYGAVAAKLEAALKSGDLASLKSAAKALEGLVKDKLVNPGQAGGLAKAIAVLKSKVGALQSADSYTQSSSSTGSAAASGSSSASSSSPRENNDRLFGAGSYDRLSSAMGVLATNPGYRHAGLALGYVMNTVATRSKDRLTATDQGAIQQAIIQLQSLVNGRGVNPAQAGELNKAIWNLQAALR